MNSRMSRAELGAVAEIAEQTLDALAQQENLLADTEAVWAASRRRSARR